MENAETNARYYENLNATSVNGTNATDITPNNNIHNFLFSFCIICVH